MSSTSPTTHIHIYNSGHPIGTSDTTPTSPTTPASTSALATSSTTTQDPSQDANSKASSTPLSEPQSLTAPLTLIPADALKVKATSTETKCTKTPKIKVYSPRSVSINMDKTGNFDDEDEDSDDSEEDSDEDEADSEGEKKGRGKSKAEIIALSLTRAVLLSKSLVEAKEKKIKKGKRMIRNGYVQGGYVLSDLRSGTKGMGVREGMLFRVLEKSVSGTVEDLEGGGVRVVYVESWREVVVVNVEKGGEGEKLKVRVRED